MRKLLVVGLAVSAVIALGLALASGNSEEPEMELKAGVQAPGFELQGSDGKIHKLSDHLGKRAVVIAWFPKAFTGG